MNLVSKKLAIQWGLGGACALTLCAGVMPAATAGPGAISAFHAAAFTQGAADKTSGDGEYAFKVLFTSSHLPAEAQAVLEKAHGGFGIDIREGQGEIYFALPGAGIIQISKDLKSTKMIPTPDDIKNNNMHNTMFWQAPSGTPYLSFPANDTAKILTAGLDGTLANTLDAPAGFDFDEPVVNAYFAAGEKFVPTDVEYLDGRFYITTGYSKLDYVLTATVREDGGIHSEWHDLAFGGKGDGAGQFGTGHGVTIAPDGKHLAIADRPNSEIEFFTRYGRFLEKVDMPKGSLPCDVDFEAGYMLVGCLEGPNKEVGAPIYLVKDNQVVSTVIIREELGLEKFAHIHNAALREINGKLYIIAQAWNPGDFAILEQVK
ncbi:MAG: hypothetical protein HYV27_02980 [Candidatus Hydrogenedentes bacterium]|nr:hypothetical protein [Candidatus Hydrogenedentota bacterium]